MSHVAPRPILPLTRPNGPGPVPLGPALSNRPVLRTDSVPRRSRCAVHLVVSPPHQRCPAAGRSPTAWSCLPSVRRAQRATLLPCASPATACRGSENVDPAPPRSTSPILVLRPLVAVRAPLSGPQDWLRITRRGNDLRHPTAQLVGGRSGGGGAGWCSTHWQVVREDEHTAAGRGRSAYACSSGWTQEHSCLPSDDERHEFSPRARATIWRSMSGPPADSRGAELLLTASARTTHPAATPTFPPP